MAHNDGAAPENFLPLNPTEFLVLAVLTDGERHGYGIVQEMAVRTGGKVKVRPGNLYRVLDRLLEQGLLVQAARKPVSGSDERRRYYRITPLGRQVAAAEAEMLAGVVSASKKLMGRYA